MEARWTGRTCRRQTASGSRASRQACRPSLCLSEAYADDAFRKMCLAIADNLRLVRHFNRIRTRHLPLELAVKQCTHADPAASRGRQTAFWPRRLSISALPCEILPPARLTTLSNTFQDTGARPVKEARPAARAWRLHANAHSRNSDLGITWRPDKWMTERPRESLQSKKGTIALQQYAELWQCDVHCSVRDNAVLSQLCNFARTVPYHRDA